MDFKIFLFCFVALLTSSLFKDTLEVRIEIPLTNPLHVSCLVDDDVGTIQKVLTIELFKDNKLLAELSKGYPIPNNKVEARFKVSGHIDGDLRKTDLTLTIVNPTVGDSGRYACIVYYLTKTNLLKQEKIIKSLTEERIYISSLEKHVQDLDQKVAVMEKRNDVNKRPVFSAYQRRGVRKAVRGQVLPFPDIIYRQGQGYNEKTSIFTAPRPGVYVFHLMVQTASKASLIQVSLNAAGKTIGTLEASNTNYWGQGSVTGVAELKTGQQVKPVVIAWLGMQTIRNDLFSTFSGYLLFPKD